MSTRAQVMRVQRAADLEESKRQQELQGEIKMAKPGEEQKNIDNAAEQVNLARSTGHTTTTFPPTARKEDAPLPGLTFQDLELYILWKNSTKYEIILQFFFTFK
ncbi:hypothetical protein RUND412_005783 [Rhizina undulata]